MLIKPVMIPDPEGNLWMRPGISVNQQLDWKIPHKVVWAAARSGQSILVSEKGVWNLVELFDICDENGQPTGQTVERSVAHREGIRHRTAHVWIVRETDGRTQILMQKRAQGKDSFPGLYDTSSAGHIPAGNEPLASALRELQEELGIQARPDQLRYAGHFNIRYETEFYGKVFRDNEYTSVYVYSEPVVIEALTLQPEEVERVDWFDLEEVREEIRHSRERFCVPRQGLEILREYLLRLENQE